MIGPIATALTIDEVRANGAVAAISATSHDTLTLAYAAAHLHPEPTVTEATPEAALAFYVGRIVSGNADEARFLAAHVLAEAGWTPALLALLLDENGHGYSTGVDAIVRRAKNVLDPNATAPCGLRCAGYDAAMDHRFECEACIAADSKPAYADRLTAADLTAAGLTAAAVATFA